VALDVATHHDPMPTPGVVRALRGDLGRRFGEGFRVIR
jgi:hypothetical protein